MKKKKEKFDPARRRLVEYISLGGIGLVGGLVLGDSLDLTKRITNYFGSSTEQQLEEDVQPIQPNLQQLEEEVAQLVKSNARDYMINHGQDELVENFFTDYTVGLSNAPIRNSNDNFINITVREFKDKKPAIFRVTHYSVNVPDGQRVFRAEFKKNYFLIEDLEKAFFEEPYNEITDASIGKALVGRLNQNQMNSAREVLLNILHFSRDHYQNTSRNYMK